LPRLAKIPTLIIWGSLDRAVDLASAHSLMELLGSSTRLAVIEGAGHLPFDETPEQFSRIVSQFLWKSASWRDGQLSNGQVSRLQVT
jgi:pimeloyl-ACP methyl ester carboxylesterase